MLRPNLLGNYISTLKVWYSYNILYLFTLFYVKISIIAFYRRLSPSQGYQIALKITAVFVAVYTVAMALTIVS